MAQEIALKEDELRALIGAELTGQGDARYYLESILGVGAQGVAFRAVRTTQTSQHYVVVKVLRPSFMQKNPAIAEIATRKEMTALRQLGAQTPPSPFVVRLLDSGAQPAVWGANKMVLPWMVLEYVHGGALGTTLDERIKDSIAASGAGFTPRRARRLLASITQGLTAIHALGIVHRDLKPSNVLLCGVGEEEIAKVTDFGVARAEEAGTFGDLSVGTPGYAAPEQSRNDKLGPWSDVFALAAIMYYAIAAEPMFTGPAAVRLANAYTGRFASLETMPRVDRAFRRGTLLAQINRVLSAGIDPDIEKRFRSARALADALEPLVVQAAVEEVTTTAATSSKALQNAAGLPWTFRIVHRPPYTLGLRSVAFGADGHALAAGADDLWFWDGIQWTRLNRIPNVDATSVRCLWPLEPRRWLAAGDRGVLSALEPTRCAWQQITGDGKLAITSMDALSERHFALLGQASGRPLVLSCLDGKWQPPVEATRARRLVGLAPAGLARWYVAGEGAVGRAYLAVYNALTASLEEIPSDAPALLDVAADAVGNAYAGALGGTLVRVRRSERGAAEASPTQRNLTRVVVDPVGDVWALAPGRILRRAERDGATTWSTEWADAAWNMPFVGLAALPNMLIAIADDGSVVIGRQDGPA